LRSGGDVRKEEKKKRGTKRQRVKMEDANKKKIEEGTDSKWAPQTILIRGGRCVLEEKRRCNSNKPSRWRFTGRNEAAWEGRAGKRRAREEQRARVGAPTQPANKATATVRTRKQKEQEK
jgi:hypothetical protein